MNKYKKAKLYNIFIDDKYLGCFTGKKLYLIKVNSKSIFNDLNTPRDFLNN